MYILMHCIARARTSSVGSLKPRRRLGWIFASQFPLLLERGLCHMSRIHDRPKYVRTYTWGCKVLQCGGWMVKVSVKSGIES